MNRRMRALWAWALLGACAQDVNILEPPTDAGVRDAAVVDAGPNLCGNGIREPSEVCDPALAGAPCEMFGMGLGTAPCQADCRAFDLSGCTGCVEDCGERVCGPGPICRQSCGECVGDEVCNGIGQCQNSCMEGTAQCTMDSSGFLACGYDEVLGVPGLGPRVACGEGRRCVAGRCSGACAHTQVVWVVDRSASMATDARWSWVREVVLEVTENRQFANRFGLVEFPGDDCTPTNAVMVQGAAASFLPSRFTAPTANNSSPLAAALLTAERAFVMPEERVVVLLTDGTETCAEADITAQTVSRLHREGIRVYLVAVAGSADRVLLDRLSRAAGTQVRMGTTVADLLTALNEILDEADACPNPVGQLTAGEYHACRLDPQDRLLCWGRPQDGQFTGNYKRVAAGSDVTCVIDGLGRLSCFGRDDVGVVGERTGTFTQVSVGNHGACGISTLGTATCWGRNYEGITPPAGPFQSVTAGYFHICGLRGDHTVACSSPSPTLVGEYDQIDAGSFTCGIRRPDRAIACTAGPSPPPGRYRQVAVGADAACAITETEQVVCWGSDFSIVDNVPTQGRYVQVELFRYYACALTADGVPVCWGDGSNGQTSPR